MSAYLSSSITPDLLARNPKFAGLLESLTTQHITETGVDRNVQTELNNVRNNRFDLHSAVKYPRNCPDHF